MLKNRINNKFGRVGVLMGGPSTERDISLKSGKAVFNSLKDAKIDVVALDIKNNDLSSNLRLIKNARIDVAFIALHGRFGEDGAIQQILEDLGMPYTGSGVMASRLAMDKIASRRIFQVHGLLVPRYREIHRDGYHGQSILAGNHLGFPLVIKPATHGSSIGLSIIDKPSEIGRAMDSAFSFDECVVVEEYIKGKEVTVGILDDMPLPVIEIRHRKRAFDYQAKYKSEATEYIVPAVLSKKTERAVKQSALLAHEFLGCEGFSRVDLIVKDNLPFILEVNTIPGLTERSLLPKAAKASGFTFNRLCLHLLDLAYEKNKVKNTL